MKELGGTPLASRARTREWEKHRTEVTEVTEGKLRTVDERPWVNTVGFPCENTRMERHRTEVTEVTEGKSGVVDERAWVNTPGFRAKTREWESIAQRSQRGNWGGG